MSSLPQSVPFPTASAAQEREPGQADPAVTGKPAAGPTLERVVQGAHEAVDRVAERAAPAVERLRSGVGAAAEALHANADEWAALGDEWIERARNGVREHPLAAVALALVAGVAVARLMSSR